MKNRQSGAVLIVSLVMLMVITMLAMSAMTTSNMQVRMAKNYQDGVTAFSEAENGLANTRFLLQGNQATAQAIVDELVANDEYVFCFGAGFGTTGELCDDGVMDDRRYDVTLDNYTTVGSLRAINITSVGTTVTNAFRTVYSHAISMNMDIDTNAALSLYDAGDLTLNGNPEISGHDHHVPNNFECNGGGCAGSDNPFGTDVIGIYSEDGADQIQNGNPVVEGAPAEQTGGGTLDADFWRDYADNANILADSYNGDGGWGTRDNPIVHVINDAGGLAVMGNLDGAGVLIVNGSDLSIGGNFHFEGIIVVMSETGASISLSGTTRVFGSMVVVGPGSAINFTGGGTPEILHSSEAIAQMTQNQSWVLRGWASN